MIRMAWRVGLFCLLLPIVGLVDTVPQTYEIENWTVFDKLGTGYIEGLEDIETAVSLSNQFGILDTNRLAAAFLGDLGLRNRTGTLASKSFVEIMSYDIDIENSSIKSLSLEANAINRDTIGWIYIPGTKVNYPILSRPGGDNYYLTRDFGGSESRSGAIFLDDSLTDLFGSVTLIHGHSMKNGTMFGSLLNFKDQAWADNHQQIFLYDGVIVKEYEVFACVLLNASKEEIPIRFSSNVARDSYLKTMLDRSKLKQKEIVDPTDVLILSTCSYEADNFRCLLFASCVRRNGR